MRLHRLSPALVFVASLSLGCAEDDQPDVEPRDGNWNYYGEGVENNSCPNDVVLPNPNSTMLIDYDGGSTFDIEQGDGNDVQCTINGSDFTCAEWLAGEFPAPDLNLTLELYIRIEGEFTSDVEAEGRQKVQMDCVGEGCGAVSDFYPCNYDLPFTAVADL